LNPLCLPIALKTFSKGAFSIEIVTFLCAKVEALTCSKDVRIKKMVSFIALRILSLIQQDELFNLKPKNFIHLISLGYKKPCNKLLPVLFVWLIFVISQSE
jgi:hypothetical protein